MKVRPSLRVYARDNAFYGADKPASLAEIG